MAVIELVDRNPEAKKVDKPKKVEKKASKFQRSDGGVLIQYLKENYQITLTLAIEQ